MQFADIIYYTFILKIFKNAPKNQKYKPIVLKANAVMRISYKRALYHTKMIEWKPLEEMHLTLTIYYTIISNVKKNRQIFEKSPIVKKSTSRNAFIL